jgi:fructokinase
MSTVALFGEALVDRFADRSVVGGAPLNVARHLAALTRPDDVQLVSRIGTGDTQGQSVVEEMQRYGLSQAHVQRDARHATGVVDISLRTSGEPTYHIAKDVAWDHIAPPQLLDAQCGLIYFGTLAQRSLISAQSLEVLLQNHPHALRFLDLNLRKMSNTRSISEASLHHANWLKINHEELALLAQWFHLGTGSAAQMRALMDRFGTHRAVLTLGADGYEAYERSDGAASLVQRGAALVVPNVADTVGAGDGFTAMWLAGHALNVPFAQSLELANQFAAQICTLRGPVPDQMNFYDPWRAALSKASKQ